MKEGNFSNLTLSLKPDPTASKGAEMSTKQGTFEA